MRTRGGYASGVRALLTRPAVDGELEWFFNRAECDMGVRSNFGRALGPRCPDSDEPSPESAAEAAHTHRRIRGWLLAIPDPDAGVLQAAYEIRPWPRRLHDDLGRLTGVVVRLACALDAWPSDRASQQIVEAARARCLESEGASGAGPLVKLRREAQVRFARAHHAYGLVRDRAPFAGRAS